MSALPAGVDGFRIAGRRLGPSALWETGAMRSALAQRDLAAVYRLLQSAGVSQRRIAAATSQSQSEISEILRGRRVVSVTVLERIADGLGVPRGAMGLAYDDTPAQTVAADVLAAARVLLTAALAMVAALGLSTVEGT